MARFAFWLIALPLLVAIAAFAVVNRGPIALELWPLPFVVTVPAFLVILLALLAGLVVGALAAWLAAGVQRREMRRRGRRIAALESEVQALRRRVAEGPEPAVSRPLAIGAAAGRR